MNSISTTLLRPSPTFTNGSKRQTAYARRAHVIIDEAQDFGMTAYRLPVYYSHLRGCTYTFMGDVSQNIHYGYGLNDWEELRSLMLNGIPDGFAVLKKSYRNTVEISDLCCRNLKARQLCRLPGGSDPAPRETGNRNRVQR